MASQSELLHFLDQHVFDPILNAGKRSGHEQKELEDVQNRTVAERERFQNYPSAEKIVEMYKDDLHSEKVKEVNSELQRLHLPILADVKDDLLKLAGQSFRGARGQSSAADVGWEQMSRPRTSLSDDQLHAILRALADPRRFAMLQQIAAAESITCSCLEEQKQISPATISHHLKELQEAGLIEVAHEGRIARLRLRRDTWSRYLQQLGQI